MNHELAKTLTTAIVQFIDSKRPEGTICCSSYECEKIEKAFEEGTYDVVENLIKRKISGLTEFEQGIRDMIVNALTTVHESSNGQITSSVVMDNNTTHLLAAGLLELAKKELLSYADESNPAIEAMADLERTFECNPDKLPGWLKNELGKKHLEGYIRGRNDALHEMSDFMESHFNTKKAIDGEDLTDLYRKEYAQPVCLRNGGVCTNPMRDCINCIPTSERLNTTSGTSTLKAEG